MVSFRKSLLAGITATGLVLAGCSSDGDGGGAGNAAANEGQDARGPITFAMGKNDIEKVQKIAERWNAEHPDEKVKIHELAGEADAQREALVQSLEASSGEFDVMALDVTWTAEFAANGYLVPLQDAMKVDTDGLLKPAVESATYNGTLYAVPQNTNGQLLFRNTELIPEAPKDWEGLRKSCEPLPEDKGCLTLQLSQYEGLSVNTLDAIHAWGGSLIDDQGKVTVDSPEAKAGLQALVDAYGDGTITKESTGATEEETMQAFTNEKSAYAVNWPYMFDAAGETPVAGKFEVTPLVGPNGVGASTLGGYNNGINAHSKHKATARDFIEYVISEQSQMGFAEESFPPVLASIYDDQKLIEKFPYLPALKESLENAKPRPVSPYYNAMSKAIQDNAYAAINGSKDVDKAIADMKAALEQASK
ncbi:ABC transporter substrate-binding protein [Corynebacterium hansenii]|uniref:ABC transporter substrate-binding protein n=1 Tax=Corynebacterium hansenii TaxID=394964 RepID=A0ABV7ZPX8_9CORY|nr:ABC transporter substrate-binding protein [Corynebacterium hansenii]WJZ00830.1 putative ABC transporter-binding protein precursor [Corynebacterium hansenii]